MKVLVTYASRSGATDAIARRVADRLETRGLQVQLVAVGEVEDIEAYDAVVIGGGTSGAHWRRPARRFVQRHEEELARRPVWLFGSIDADTPTDGTAEPHAGAERPREFDEFHRLVEAEDEAVFTRPRVTAEPPAGVAERLRQWLPAGRGPVTAADVHDQPHVDAWAEEIAGRLESMHRDRAIDAVHEMHEMHELDEVSDSESDGA